MEVEEDAAVPVEDRVEAKLKEVSEGLKSICSCASCCELIRSSSRFSASAHALG